MNPPGQPPIGGHTRDTGAPVAETDGQMAPSAAEPSVPTAPSHSTAGRDRRPWPERLDVDPQSVDRGLASLVLTVVELIRQLMERQALHRVDQGDLTNSQIEEIGNTLMLLEERMTELREHFDLTPDDLNIDLGPLGPLLPRQ